MTHFALRTNSLCGAAAVLVFVCCSVSNSQLPTAKTQTSLFNGLLPDGEARTFVSAFEDTACIRDLQRMVTSSDQIKYFVCPKTLSLVRLKLASSLDKSRYTILLRAVTDAEPMVDFHEVSGTSLKQCGIDPEAIFLVLFPLNQSTGMGAKIGPIVEIRIQEKQIRSFRESLLKVL